MPQNGVREWWRPTFLYRLHWVLSFLSGSQDPHRRVKCVSLCFLFSCPQAANRRDSQGGRQESPYPSMPPNSQWWSCCRFICAWSQESLPMSPPTPSRHLHATCLVGLKIPDGAWEQSRPVAIETRYYPSSMQLPSFLFPVLSLRCSDRNKSGWSTQILPTLNVHLHSHQPWGTPGMLRFLKWWGDDLISSSSDQDRSDKAMLWHHLFS